MNRIPLNGKQLTLVVIGAIASLTLGWGACGNTPGNPQDPKPKRNTKIKKLLRLIQIAKTAHKQRTIPKLKPVLQAG